jgi:hypothetical protein
MLAVAKPVQEIIDMPSELVAEHWYRRKYNQEPPHLDWLYTGNEPMTDELRITLEQRQVEEETRLQEQEEAELAAAMVERQRHNVQPVAGLTAPGENRFRVAVRFAYVPLSGSSDPSTSRASLVRLLRLCPQ